MIPSEISTYFEGIASQLKRVSHSVNDPRFTTNFEEDYNAIWSKIKSPFLALEFGTARLKRHGDGHVDLKRLLISVHVPVGDLKKSKTARSEAADSAETILKQIFARMIEDGENPVTCPVFLAQFDTSTILYEHSESKVPNFVTCFASFELEDYNFLELNESEWL
jgi:hypothetical protein